MFQHFKWRIRTGRMKLQVNTKSVANFERPNCAACEFGKGSCLPNKVNTIKKNPMKEYELKKYHLMTGHMVSAYHYISWDPGRLYHKKKSHPSGIFSVACVFMALPVVIWALSKKWL